MASGADTGSPAPAEHGNGSGDGSDGTLLPWLQAPLEQALRSQRGHALLLHAAPGSGALPLALALARSWLCEGTAAGLPPAPACGRCGSCQLVRAQAHPDLFVLLPELQRRHTGWLVAHVDKPDDDGKRKPSRQIRIDTVRALIDWTTRTSSRGRAKVAVLHPAEALNLQAANALLKTLEEPAPGTRLLLTAGDPAQLLPTVRSRCQLQRVAEPEPALAVAWLQSHGVADAAAARTLLAACSGRPLDALSLLEAGVDAAAWAALPAAVARGNAAGVAGWPLPRALDALHKLCHDAMSLACGGPPRYFPVAAVPSGASVAALAAWSRELDRVARHDDHPWHEGLLLESLVDAGARALALGGTAAPAAAPGAASGRPHRVATLRP